mmetsp:Transcript_35512/g.36180  ORF Transcript_35512/g.36180 Transcript_35512/m.36180 type:complete len:351 (-) Transcript_35512:221-1273(-)
MGTSQSNSKRKYKRKIVWSSKKISEELQIQMILDGELTIPMALAIAHYTPASFPMHPVVSKRSSALCSESWSKILQNENVASDGVKTSGIVVFYNEFYERLNDLDSSGKFEAVLSRHSNGGNKSAAKGEILVRIIQYVLKIEEDNQQTQLLLFMLGRSHAQKLIRPWQYAVFVETLLLTISSRLRNEATTEVMSAWVHLFAYIMNGMLPNSIKGQIVETEMNVNTSSEFSSGKIAEEVQILEEEKALRKKFGSGMDSSRMGSSRMGSSRVTGREAGGGRFNQLSSRNASSARAGPGPGAGVPLSGRRKEGTGAGPTAQTKTPLLPNKSFNTPSKPEDDSVSQFVEQEEED